MGQMTHAEKSLPISLSAAAKVVYLAEEKACQADGLMEALQQAGFVCERFFGVRQAIQRLDEGGIDLLLLESTLAKPQLLQLLRESVEGYLSVVLVYAVNAEDDVAEAVSAMIDGVIVQPVEMRLLRMTLNSAWRIRKLHQYQTEQHRQLNYFRLQTDSEQEVAANIYNKVLQGHFLQTGVVKFVMSPKALFNGDLLLVERTPNNNLYLLLGDFTGHGLSASVVAMPVADIFYGMTRKGFALEDIVRQINAKLCGILPANRFLAATAVALYPDTKSLTLITCGLPEHFLVNELDDSRHVIHSLNFPLGIEKALTLEEQHFGVNRHHHLYLMTDGVFEAENQQGTAFGAKRIEEAICRKGGGGFERLKAMLAEHTAGLEQQDDISLVKLICDVDEAPWQGSRMEGSARPIKSLSWKTRMEFGIDALRSLNPVPVMVDLLMEIQGLQAYRQSIYLIIGELFANALDHGLLKLDSAVKTSPEGFMRFYQQREAGLQDLRQGRIKLLFTHQPTEKGGRLMIRISDSGEGFDWQALPTSLQDNRSFSGRGLKLVESLCTELTFHGKGNRVTAVFDWVP